MRYFLSPSLFTPFVFFVVSLDIRTVVFGVQESTSNISVLGLRTVDVVYVVGLTRPTFCRHSVICDVTLRRVISCDVVWSPRVVQRLIVPYSRMRLLSSTCNRNTNITPLRYDPPSIVKYAVPFVTLGVLKVTYGRAS